MPYHVQRWKHTETLNEVYSMYFKITYLDYTGRSRRFSIFFLDNHMCYIIHVTSVSSGYRRENCYICVRI